MLQYYITNKTNGQTASIYFNDKFTAIKTCQVLFGTGCFEVQCSCILCESPTDYAYCSELCWSNDTGQELYRPCSCDVGFYRYDSKLKKCQECILEAK
jgi:hypothetical protein